MDRNGIVIEERAEYAKIQLVRHTACGNCGACHLGDDQKEITLLAKNDLKAGVGDLVEVTMATGSVLSAAFIAYIIPLMGLLLGLVLGQVMFAGSDSKDVLSAGMALLVMALVFLVIKLADKRLLKSDKYIAKISNVLQRAHDEMVPLAMSNGAAQHE